MLTDIERQQLEREQKIARLRLFIDEKERLMMAERKTRLPLLVALLTMVIVAYFSSDASAQMRTAFFTHETHGGGLTKQCHYQSLGERYSITVNSVSICPLSIQV